MRNGTEDIEHELHGHSRQPPREDKSIVRPRPLAVHVAVRVGSHHPVRGFRLTFCCPSEVRKSVRELFIPRTPFTLIYRVAPKQIEILRLWDGRQGSDY